jgi:hypothetical protein
MFAASQLVPLLPTKPLPLALHNCVRRLTHSMAFGVQTPGQHQAAPNLVLHLYRHNPQAERKQQTK